MTAHNDVTRRILRHMADGHEGFSCETQGLGSQVFSFVRERGLTPLTVWIPSSARVWRSYSRDAGI